MIEFTSEIISYGSGLYNRGLKRPGHIDAGQILKHANFLYEIITRISWSGGSDGGSRRITTAKTARSRRNHNAQKRLEAATEAHEDAKGIEKGEPGLTLLVAIGQHTF